MESNNVGAVREPPNVETRDLASRVEKLEKANRRITWVSLALGAGFILMFALAADQPGTTPDVLRAKKLEIVDGKGKTRIVLEVFHLMPGDIQEPGIRLLDEDGLTRGGLRESPGGAGLYLQDEKGKPRINLLVSEGGPALTLFDEEMHIRSVVSLESGMPSIELLSDNFKVIWQAPPK